jgi:tetratricopeptide (TPR) repeat protein
LEPARKAVELTEKELGAQLLLLHVYFLLKESAAAEEMVQGLTRQHSKNPVLFMVLGDIAFSVQNWELAISRYQESIALDPEFDRPYLQMGQAYLFQEMQRLQNKSNTPVPNLEDPRAMMAHMNELIASGGMHLDRARAAFRKALYLNPENTEAHIMLGILAFHRSDYEEATLEWEEALRRETDSVFLYTALGLSAQQRKKYEDAARYFTRLRELSPQQIEPVMLEVFLAIAQKEHARAVQSVLNALPLFPKLEEALFQNFALAPPLHVPWLISLLSHPDKEVAAFCARVLSFISHRPESLDQKAWEIWWNEEIARHQEQWRKNMEKSTGKR